jgi:dienelactone hydrolase
MFLSFRFFCVVAWALLVLPAAIPAESESDSTPDMPWDLEQLFAPPEWHALERPSADGVKAISFSGPAFQGRPTQVFAWLGIPELEEGAKAPAMVLVHGGGGTAFDEWVRLWTSRGYAAIAMDTCGQVPVGNYGNWVHNTQGGPPGWGGFDQVDWPMQDQWTYHAVADAILAHSLIRSLPEVDAERTGVTGISWGGYLTCILAGVDARFKLAVPVYGCGFYRETVFGQNIEQLGSEQGDQWMGWWDPSVYLGQAAMPMLWVNGSNDFAYWMGAMQKSYRLPKGPRTLCVRLRMPHAHGGAGENPEEIRVFADHILRDEAGLAEIVSTWREDREVWVDFLSSAKVTKVELNYTLDDKLAPDTNWRSLDADLSDSRATAELPEDTRFYYFNLFDERDCVVSSEHEKARQSAIPE